MKTDIVNKELEELESKNYIKESSEKIKISNKKRNRRDKELPGAPKINNDFGMWD
jgi:hypothetical protein